MLRKFWEVDETEETVCELWNGTGIIKRITYEVLWKFSENFENVSFRVSLIKIVKF